MEIQALYQNDLQFLTALQPVDWPDITPHLDLYIQSPFCFPIKITVGENIAGIGAAIIHNEVAWLAHIIVHPDFRNKGIGKAVAEALVDRSRVENCETVYLIATEMGAPVYEKVGFKTDCEYVGFKDGVIDSPAKETSGICRYGENYKQQILDLDREVTGENRFFRIEEHLQDGYVYVVDDKLEGYYLPSFGEGLVIANTGRAGIVLLRLRVSKSNNVRFPINNKVAFNFFKENNYIQYIGQKRMLLGKPRIWQPENLYSRTGGQVG